MWQIAPMSSSLPVRSPVLLIVAAVLEAGGVWAVWQGCRGNRGLLWLAAGLLALAAFGFLATLHPDGNFGRVLAAYGGVFVAASAAWRLFRTEDRPVGWEMVGAALCVVGATLILYGPRSR
jgi:small multidrug resistance family-3 protein